VITSYENSYYQEISSHATLGKKKKKKKEKNKRQGWANSYVNGLTVIMLIYYEDTNWSTILKAFTILFLDMTSLSFSHYTSCNWARQKKQADMQSTVSSAIGCGNRRKPCPDLQLPPWKHSTTHDSRPLQNKNFENLKIQLGYKNDHSDNRPNLFQAMKLSSAIYVHTMRRHRAMSQIQQYLNAEQYYFGNKANWMLTVCFNYS